MTGVKENFTISTDKQRLDAKFIHNYLSRYSYWAEDIPLEIVEKAIAGSLCFGIYHQERQVGFGRMVTDMATFAYLADVFIDESYRGRGLGKWLVSTILSHPDLQGLRRIMLGTRDAHGLYAQFGFTPLTEPGRFMQIAVPGIYRKKAPDGGNGERIPEPGQP